MEFNSAIKGLELHSLSSSSIKVQEQASISNRDIAIVGMSCMFGESLNKEQFWGFLHEGKDMIRELPLNRHKEMTSLHQTLNLSVSKEALAQEAGFLENISSFDNEFFNILPSESKLMDPQQRLFLQNAWHTIEDAGYSKEIKGTRTGVFLGYGSDFREEYKTLIMHAAPDLYERSIQGNLRSIMASRISYLLDLKGPSMVVDTACSSSLVAVHLACKSIRSGESNMAIAGGIDVRLVLPRLQNVDIGILSSNGRTRSFDRDSDGSGSGEGVGSVLLKPLKQALKDRDHIYAVIKGSAINQDGKSMGITAPNPVAQEEVLIDAWNDARIDPSTISYIEAHGSGTKLGDPIELDGLSRAFSRFTDKKQFCAIGSVKSNVGHLGNAAGIAGLVKSVLAMQHKKIPESLHFHYPNTNIDFAQSPIYVNNYLQDWEVVGEDLRRCGVSSFGMSGTNCHVVLEEWLEPETAPQNAASEYYIFMISAKTFSSLTQTLKNYQHNKSYREFRIADLAYSASVRKEHYPYRMAFAVRNSEELYSKLHAFGDKDRLNPNLTNVGYFKVVPEDKDCRSNGEITLVEQQKLSQQLVLKLNEFIQSGARDESLANEAISLYLSGADADWNILFNKNERWIPLPAYSFDQSNYWLELSDETANLTSISKVECSMLANSPSSNIKKNNFTEERFLKVLSQILGKQPDQIDVFTDFFEMGMDSILLVHLMNGVKDEFNLDLQLSLLFSELSYPYKLIEYLEVHAEDRYRKEINLPTNSAKKSSITIEGGHLLDSLSGNRSSLENIIQTQLQIMAEQLKVLGNLEGEKLSGSQMSISNAQSMQPLNKPYVPFQKNDINFPNRKLSTYNEQLQKFSEEYTAQTSHSKQMAQRYRAQFANNRNVAGFRPNYKEMLYPIVVQNSKGSKIWDIDGKEYIDLSMGFGVNLFGHNPPFIMHAIQEELGHGIALGPMSRLSGEVASLICELTGVERVAFFNSGTDANMVALRLARAYTNRSKIAIFAGSFHGTFDGLLGRQRMSGNEVHRAVPIAPGIPASMMEDLLVLNYDDPQSLDLIDQYADQIAAVLVEPVQSRRPDVQPNSFLQNLRNITREKGIVLIFDEVITGFRIHPGGAQAWFDVQADLVTYGKVIGGGMPVGVVSGKAPIMDGIDGGYWAYGDDSFPQNESKRTFVAGTFCHHPLAMASSLATLKYLAGEGPALQEQLNRRTENLIREINQYFETHQIPIHVVSFGSLFRFQSSEDLEFFYYQLIHEGIYIWEGRNCFLSTAHSDEDIATIIKTVKRSSEYLNPNIMVETGEKNVYELTSGQSIMYLEETRNGKGIKYKVPGCLLIEGPLDYSRINEVVVSLIERHDVLRTSFQLVEGRPVQIVQEKIEFELEVFSNLTEQEAVETFYRPFNLSKAPLFRIGITELEHNRSLFMIDFHHLISDGLSVVIFQKEFMELYQGRQLEPVEWQYKDFVRWNSQHMLSPEMNEHEQYWLAQLGEDPPELHFPTDYKRSELSLCDGEKLVFILNSTVTKKIKELARTSHTTLFIVLLAMYNVVLSKSTAQEDLLVGTSVMGRLHPKTDKVMGMFLNFLVLRNQFVSTNTFNQFLEQVKSNTVEAYAHQSYPYHKLVEKLKKKATNIFNTMFVMDNYPSTQWISDELTVTGYPLMQVPSVLDFHVEALEVSDEIQLSLIYAKALFHGDTMEQFGRNMVQLFEYLAENPDVRLSKAGSSDDNLDKQLEEFMSD
ncbi:hypothetical protein BS614_26195 [Paenibacillus xylanexedens]|uniref:aminotransferase class III-fold pyridoxal phosphate-dependent enzyme n=1 Tax=Paenibacillus xylanexedens TaxID=528191 RepID=UPI0009381F4F|nr:aminotransferase class III-fold pyridoxal phosphate-dependent enzyme [Paenibacillus xylanexedens]APO47197.1 hypothetical protein BS614_26195 [Paenibacillus xylanexedens]